MARHEVRQPTIEDVRKNAQLLVIDDHAFAYEQLFTRDGYHITRWPTVRNLSQLTDEHFDLILLDLHGVGLKESPEQQGLGILSHVKQTNPAQLVVAYTAVPWSASFHEFFALADAVLEKDDEYITFKSAVDRLLLRRHSQGYFIGRMNSVLGDGAALAPRAVAKALRSIQRQNVDALRRYLSNKLPDPATVDRAIAIIGLAIKVLG